MKYLFYQMWPNTVNNHSGIKYLCEQLEAHYPKEYKALQLPLGYVVRERRLPGKLKSIAKYIDTRIAVKKKENDYCDMARQIFCSMNDGDEAFMMEYMHPMINQYIMVKEFRRLGFHGKIYGMAHMPPKFMDENFSDRSLTKWIQPIDGLITLGSSLTSYFEGRGVESTRVSTMFHYVSEYYLTKDIAPHAQLTVIALGNNYRDMDTLRQVVLANPAIRFIVCQGVMDYSAYFSGANNVKLVPFVQEEELRTLMSEADISLNSMYDTIGSNVIVTSLAMGLAMICSDVGSIRDYCNEDDTIFCRTVDDFNLALRHLSAHHDLLLAMRKAAREHAKAFRIDSFHKVFSKL